MPRGYSRSLRAAHVIQEAIAELLPLHFVDLPAARVTVTGVTVSPDYSIAKVYVSMLIEDEKERQDLLEKLNAERKPLRYQLAHAIKMRVTPELRFYFDESIVQGRKMSDLINRVTPPDDQA